MAIIGTLPNNLQNGTIADATQVMADLNFIVNQVNANGVQIGVPQPGALLNIQAFTVAGTFTYTPTVGTTKIIVDGQGAGGGGGGSTATTGSQCSIGVGGGAGAHAGVLLTSGFSGATVVVGAAGSGGVAGNNGVVGGNTTFGGTLLVCPGGSFGVFGAAATPPFVTVSSGISATPSSTQSLLYLGVGEASKSGASLTTTVVMASNGSSSFFGGGGLGFSGTGGNGQTAITPGGGGGGGASLASQAGFAGGTGGPGRVIIYEYA